MKYRCVVLAFGLLMSLSAFAGFDEGLKAYKSNDYARALQEWHPLAEQGDAHVQYNLGQMYYFGQGVAKDEAKAVWWMTKAADQGNADAQYNLGVMYAHGLGVAKDESKAVQWYTKAAEQGLASAQSNLGLMYAQGRGVAKDESKAVQWYTEAAEHRDADAQYNLGVMYAHGQGVAKDKAKAVQWYTKAAEQGLADAQSNLGLMYANGRGVLQNDLKAAKMLSQAAQQNNMNALNNLGFMYEHERGVEHDVVLSHVFYNLAAAAGHETAAEKRSRIAEQLSPAQLREAQAIAEAWKVGTPVPTKSKTGLVKALPQHVVDAKSTKPLNECQPPKGKELRYSDNCNNGDCVRTFENGCSKRFQAPYCFDPMQQQWTWKPDGC